MAQLSALLRTRGSYELVDVTIGREQTAQLTIVWCVAIAQAAN
jgi:hypothetical protein